MSQSQDKRYARAQYLQNLLIAHLTGRNVNESDYHKLRHYFMGMADTTDLVPEMVVEHSDLSSLWHSMRYSHATHEARKDHIVETFMPLLAFLGQGQSSSSVSESGVRGRITEQVIQDVWLKAQELCQQNGPAALGQMSLLVEKLCYQLLKELKVVPDPLQHNLAGLVSLAERSLLLSPGKRYALVVKSLIESVGELHSAISGLTAEKTSINGKQTTLDAEAIPTLINLHRGLATLLLAAWEVRQLATFGATQR